MNHDINIKIGNEIIERVNNTNFLGLIIDDDLSWKHHIIKVTSKISKLCGTRRLAACTQAVVILRSTILAILQLS